MKTISLCGFMASGKTTIAKLLSQQLNLNLIDTDKEIESLENLTIDEIFKKCGEQKFRELEANFFKNLNFKENSIISTGGGLFLNQKNIKIAKKNSIIIFLNTSLKNCLLRCKNFKRPLLQKPKAEIENLFKKRQKLYLKISDISIENNSTAKICCQQIIEKLSTLFSL